MRILYFHLPQIMEHMKKTNDFMKNCKYDVIDCVTPREDDFAMWKNLVVYWGKEDIIKVDQDNVPTNEIIESLVSCNHDLCVSPCLIYPVASGLSIVMQNQIIIENGKRRLLHPYETREYLNGKYEFVDFAGLGLCKISISIQKIVDISEHGFHWLQSDTIINNAIHGCFPKLKWHVHDMHEHTKQTEECIVKR